MTDSTWHAGDSDLAGDILIDDSQQPSHLTANLVSQKLVFADLAPLVGAPPGNRGNISPQQAATEQQLEARGELFPNVPLHVERLRAMNMDVTLDAKRVVAPSYLPVTALRFRVLVDNGVATVNPLAMAVAGGQIGGELGIDARRDVPTVRAGLALTNLDFGAFFRGSRFFGTTQGQIRGRVQLVGAGRSLAQVMGAANGSVEVVMEGGAISDLMVSLAGLQIVDALVLYVTGDHRIPIRCALGRLDFRNGTVTFDRTLLDTQKSVLRVEGQAGLSSQVVNVKILADPKKFDLLDLHGPVSITGKIRAPTIAVERPIPHPVIGTAKDLACEALAQQLLAGKP
ncbi:AsmA family protein [Enhydrobacter aerosaccus]|uniref:AsmA family protein n=1 Tax=Enhydrobacter aerosaccus TaxID=225324 RepID=A0A1T4LL56_9HYPH|nr:AsmA family protein [Enhydrobacter aerosaccus]SJZ55470.1 AsmA family protein [Enhydrobacter aerosaccus]